jgi:hypothetical protein
VRPYITRGHPNGPDSEGILEEVAQTYQADQHLREEALTHEVYLYMPNAVFSFVVGTVTTCK